MTDIETIREALEAAQEALSFAIGGEPVPSLEIEASKKLTEALRLFDEMVKAEPVAWMCGSTAGVPGGYVSTDLKAIKVAHHVDGSTEIIPLYTNPIACKPQEGMVMVRVDDLRAVLLIDQTKDAEQRMDARNRLNAIAKEPPQ